MDIAAVSLLFVFGLPALLVLWGVLRLYNIARILDERMRPQLDALSLAVYVRLRVWSARATRWHRYHSIKGSRYRRQWRHSPKGNNKMKTIHWPIDWSLVPDRYDWVAADSGGDVYAYVSPPARHPSHSGMWNKSSIMGRQLLIGTTGEGWFDWTQSLVQRPIDTPASETATANPVPFGKLSRDAKLELMAAWVDGKPIEALIGGTEWHPVSPPAWANDLCYRVRVVPPSIDWSAVAPQYRWLAIDQDGAAYLYTAEPTSRYGREWAFDADGNQYTGAIGFASFQPGTLPWGQSLVKRPEGV